MKIHFIGIGGIGTSALAQYYLAKGFSISGSDAVENETIEYLRKLGAKIPPGPPLKRGKGEGGHNAENVPADANLVIYNAAIGEDNPELKRARELKIETKLYAEALGELTKQMKTIAVSGMHGKSTTTAMIGLIMEKVGFDPTVIVGSKVREWGESNFRFGKSEWLVIEADEYNASFLNYRPQIIVLTNIEEEHLDTYKDLDDIINTFGEYISHLGEDGMLIYNGEDENIDKAISKKIPNPKLQKIQFNSKITIPNLNLKLLGKHNLMNAYAAISAARAIGISDEISIETLNGFSGIWRRMEYRGQFNGAKIYDDYAHHPTEIKATLEGLREILISHCEESKGRRSSLSLKATEEQGNPADGNNNSDSPRPLGARDDKCHLWCVFQPHQYDRIRKLFDRFISAFDAADKTIILPIYSVAGRESEEAKQKVSSEKLVKAINEAYKSASGETIYIDSFEKTAEYLKNNLKQGDIAVIMGAGDVYRMTNQLIS
ncbi:MAG: UDP-N-acetylmuramate-L-alanine ligase [Parcubacteria group bacterium GW2011_GWC1_43_12]|nr:MAG: UDP-N-acetylmuramate-L-alanine ligase [Parcubacteria group bacterium GW2011_GWC1_43_12]